MKSQVFLNIASEMSKLSKDQRTKVGAVLTVDGMVISTGYNGFPRKINDHDESRQVRPKKYFYMAHAEVNAICNAARLGVATYGSHIYVTMFPCHNCAIAIIQAGITRIVVPTIEFREDMKDSYRASIEMLLEANIQVFHHDNDITAHLHYLIKNNF